jgi:hypothetical protein
MPGGFWADFESSIKTEFYRVFLAKIKSVAISV